MKPPGQPNGEETVARFEDYFVKFSVQAADIGQFVTEAMRRKREIELPLNVVSIGSFPCRLIRHHRELLFDTYVSYERGDPRAKPDHPYWDVNSDLIACASLPTNRLVTQSLIADRRSLDGAVVNIANVDLTIQGNAFTTSNRLNDQLARKVKIEGEDLDFLLQEDPSHQTSLDDLRLKYISLPIKLMDRYEYINDELPFRPYNKEF